jgi:transcriptional regulator with XRE-family HTH domain
LSRQLSINRTQFNRYLSGESFPRPDVLGRICSFFNVDARILLEPVELIGRGEDPVSNPYLRDFVGAGTRDVSERVLPSGFFRFSRRSFLSETQFVMGLVMIFRNGPNTFLRGLETRRAMQMQQLPDHPDAREFRGFVCQQEDAVAIIVSRRNTMTSSFNYLSKVASYDNNFWLGFVNRSVPEAAVGLRATRLVYEYLGNRVADALPAARTAGFFNEEDLPPFHRRLLQPDQPFR